MTAVRAAGAGSIRTRLLALTLVPSALLMCCACTALAWVIRCRSGACADQLAPTVVKRLMAWSSLVAGLRAVERAASYCASILLYVPFTSRRCAWLICQPNRAWAAVWR